MVKNRCGYSDVLLIFLRVHRQIPCRRLRHRADSQEQNAACRRGRLVMDPYCTTMSKGLHPSAAVVNTVVTVITNDTSTPTQRTPAIARGWSSNRLLALSTPLEFVDVKQEPLYRPPVLTCTLVLGA